MVSTFHTPPGPTSCAALSIVENTTFTKLTCRRGFYPKAVTDKSQSKAVKESFYSPEDSHKVARSPMVSTIHTPPGPTSCAALSIVENTTFTRLTCLRREKVPYRQPTGPNSRLAP